MSALFHHGKAAKYMAGLGSPAQEFRGLFSHQRDDEISAKSEFRSQKPVVALIVACGQIVAGKGSATELQQAPVSEPAF